MGKKIFISSTYHDLIPHREQVWRVLENFDVTITGMEEFGARKSTPLDTCLKEVEESDIFIGIIALRYGSEDRKTRKSYTQLEYERAVGLGLDILIYLVDERKGEVKTGSIDFGDKYLKLKEFKEILKENHTVDFFINEIDLGQKIYIQFSTILTKQGQTIIRPRSLDAKIKVIGSGKSQRIIFIGYLYGKPFEIFTTLSNDVDGVLLPRNITDGLIIQSFEDKNLKRYDFQYFNKRGYKTTIEGIDFRYPSQIKTFDKIISSLLQSNVAIQTIITTVKDMETEGNDNKIWIESIIEILSNK